MSYWSELLQEEVATQQAFEKEQREIKRLLKGKQCPSWSEVVRRLNRDRKRKGVPGLTSDVPGRDTSDRGRDDRRNRF